MKVKLQSLAMFLGMVLVVGTVITVPFSIGGSAEGLDTDKEIVSVSEREMEMGPGQLGDGMRYMDEDLEVEYSGPQGNGLVGNKPVEHEDGWHSLYGHVETEENDVEWRYHPAAATGKTVECTWYSAMILDLSDRVGEITDVAYYDMVLPHDENVDSAVAHISTDDNGAPAEPFLASSEEYDGEDGGWIELELEEAVEIDPDEVYWVVMEFEDRGDLRVPQAFVSEGDAEPEDPRVESSAYSTGVNDDPHDPDSWKDDTSDRGAYAIEARVEGPSLYSRDPEPEDEATGVGVDPELSVYVGHKEEEMDMDVSFYDASDDSLIDTVEGVQSGDRASVEWTDIGHGTEYSWYVVVDDGEESFTSETWSFTTAALEIVKIYPEADREIPAGESLEFSAEAYDEYDNLITDEAEDFEWVNAEEGMFEETKVGEYDVTATYHDVTSEPTTMTVEPAEVDRVDMYPRVDFTITAGDSERFFAEAYDEYDNLIADSIDDPFDFMWENAEAALGGAEFEETEAGEYDVTATYEGVPSFPTTVTVEPAEVDEVEISVEDSTIKAGETTEFTAEAYDEYANLITDDPGEFDWENADDGVFDETEAGEHDVTATYDRVSSESVTVTVEPAEVDEVEIDPVDDQVISAGEIIEFAAEAYDEYDNLITDEVEDFDWENADGGMFDETEAGEYEVQTLYEGVGSDEVIVTVEPREVNYVEIDPDEDETVDSGETIEFSARAYDEYDNLITDDPADFDWENADDGVFDKTEGGDFDVSAEYDGEPSDSVTVTVETAVPGFTLALLLLASVIAVAIYHKKKQ